MVIDPSGTQALAGGSFLFKDPGSTGAPTVTVTPQDAGLGYIGSFTVHPGHAANGQVPVNWHFDLGANAITQTVTQSYDVTVAEAQPNGANGTATQSLSVTVGGPGNDTFVFKPGFGSDVIANATSADTIELDGFSSVPNINQLHTLLTEAQAGQSLPMFHTAHGGQDTVINLGHHDSITLANVHLADLHASNFIVR